MWNVNPSFMCTAHLVSEHREMHMLAGALNGRMRLSGHVARGLIELDNVHQRHDGLVTEMQDRGLRHRSPLPQVRARGDLAPGYVCETVSAAELQRRCTSCRDRFKHLGEYVSMREPHVCTDVCAERIRRDQAARQLLAPALASQGSTRSVS